MQQSVQEALSGLRNLGTPQEMQSLAGQGYGPAVRPKVNSHIHLPPNFSAFETVKQAVDLAAQQNVGVVGVSNYYDYQVYGEFVTLARRKKIFPLFGLEIICLIDELVKAGVKINDPGNPGKMYICGKGITRFADFTPQAKRLLGIIRKNDSERMHAMIDLLAKIFETHGLKTGLDEYAVKMMVVNRHGCAPEVVYLQERHLAQAFQEALFKLVPPADRITKFSEIIAAPSKSAPEDAVKIQNEIRSHLMKAGKPAFVEETFVNFDQAYRLILELGGIPCYPTLADGTSPICGYEEPVEKLIQHMKDAKIYCAEYIPIRNTPEVLSRYVKAVRKAGICVLGGTEHNTLDLLGIEPTCLKTAPVPDDIKEIFWEGACVVAAHQYLTLHGQCGYVDGEGRLNQTYKTDESRIAAFRSLGAAVIRKYEENNNL